MLSLKCAEPMSAWRKEAIGRIPHVKMQLSLPPAKRMMGRVKLRVHDRLTVGEEL